MPERPENEPEGAPAADSRAPPAALQDKELEEFRNLMVVPGEFEEGFNWTSLLGALFVGFIMVPGAIYMGLLAGVSNIGPAAQWVTAILFVEVARRAQRQLRKAEIFVLFFMAGAAMNMPFSGLLWNQFFARSDAAMGAGVAQWLPAWFAPPADSPAYDNRSFFQLAWLPVIGLVIFRSFFGRLSNVVLGYGLFRLASDVERLPFPMAPIGALGIMALAEDVEERSAAQKEASWRWRMFSIGGALGLGFGAIYLLLPILTGALTGKPITLLPIPFFDSTPKTQEILPAVATGLSFDLAPFIFGMVFPFWAVFGSFVGLIITFVLNPILYHMEILTGWERGDSLPTTMFKNNVNFYFSFTIGISLAIAAAGFYQIYKKVIEVRRRRRETGERGSEMGLAATLRATAPKGRGDMPPWFIIACYFFVTMAYILLSGWLIGWHPGVMVVLFGLGFVYTPLISYVTARLEGIVGQVIEIPMIREASLILSGYRGVDVWFLPIPMANYGRMTMMYRRAELTGTKFTGLWKTSLFLFPFILVTSIIFANFIWSLADVPSAVYPFAQKMWELRANNACIMFSSTLGGYSMFEEAFRPLYLFLGLGFGTVLFAGMANLGAPIFLVYGVVKGLGQTLPTVVIPQMAGALLGRYYFQRKFGKMWRKYIAVVAAGVLCGQGLITVFGIGITFISKAVIQIPF